MNGLPTRRGRVVDPGGVPVAGARVVIAASSVPMPEIAVVSDALGCFALRLPAGRFTVRAHGLDGATGEVEVEGGAGAGDIVITTSR